jgi:radical SAM enzyme (TIGR01210 family)
VKPRSEAEAEIQRGTREVGKTYEFDEQHDPGLPVDLWWQHSHEGRVLFVVFYSQACRWSRCRGCNLPSKCSLRPVGYRELMEQVDHVFSRPDVLESAASVRKVILSNNGSMLDEATFSTTALVYALAKINLHLPEVAVLSLETRVEYVDLAELEVLSRVLAESSGSTRLELAVGFEVFDERIRNQVFCKGLNLEALERLARMIAPYGFHLKCYLMQKAVPDMSDQQAVDDVCRALDYLAALAHRYGVEINAHLNPTYVASGTPLEQSYLRGEYRPPRLLDVVRAVRYSRDKPVSVFVGLYDEGLALDGGSFIRPGDEPIVRRLEHFNRTQDYSQLDGLD